MDVGVLAMILLIVGTMTVLVSVLCGVNPLWLTCEEIRSRVAEIVPYLAILALVYVFNRASHTVGQRLSR